MFKVPDNRKIGENAFNGCVYLKKLYITDMSEDMGYDERCTGCKTYVKKNSKLAKKLDKNGDKYNVY